MRPKAQHAQAPFTTPVQCRGIFVTGSSLVGAAIRQPRITSKNLIRWAGEEAPQLNAPGWGRWNQGVPACRSIRTLPHPSARCLWRARSVIFCEATAIYGVIVAIILQVRCGDARRWAPPRAWPVSLQDHTN